MADFDDFWAAYPLRRAKLAAIKAYEKARTQASAAEILAGVEAYKRHLPDDPQFICRPTTFLNQGRWMDEYDVPVKVAPVAPDANWFEECRDLHGGSCGGRLRHYNRMQIDKMKAEAS